jgi:Zn-dependent protease
MPATDEPQSRHRPAASGVNRPRGLGLGRIAGVEVRLDLSLLIIFVLITLGLAMGLFPMWHADWSLALTLFTAASAAVLFLLSVLLHELSHAVVGRSMGMRIERITLFVFGGMAHMEDEPATWRSELAMAIVGPIASLLIGLGCLLLAHALAGPIEIDPEDPTKAIAELGPLTTLLLWLGPVNIVLAVFNLVPGFPLDGGRVLRAVLWGATGDRQRATRWASGAGQAFAWFLIASGFAMILGLRVPIFGSGPIAGLWIALIGWFLNNAASMSYQRLVLQESLKDVTVQRLMHRDFVEVAPQAKVSELIESRVLRSSQRVFPVSEDGRFVGLVCLQDMRQLAREERDRTAVSEIMTPRDRLRTLGPEAKAEEALKLLAEGRFNQVPVIEGDDLKGLVTREDILTWLAFNPGGSEQMSEQGERLLGGR